MIWLLAAATPSPSPVAPITEVTATPGIVGFLLTFAMVALALVVFRFMSRSLRRVRRNAEAAGIPIVVPRRLGPPQPVSDEKARSEPAPVNDERHPQ
jgi:hypothetical protein